MENTKRLYINPTIEKQVRNYCEINGIDDVNAFANRCALQGLNILKYGTSPIDNVNRESNGVKDIKKDGSKKKENSIKKQDDIKSNLGEKNKEEPIKKKEEIQEEVKVKTRRIQIIKKS